MEQGYDVIPNIDRITWAFPWLVALLIYITGVSWYLSRKPLPETKQAQAENKQGEVSPKIMAAIVASVAIIFFLLMELIRCNAVGCYTDNGRWVGDQSINRLEMQYRE